MEGEIIVGCVSEKALQRRAAVGSGWKDVPTQGWVGERKPIPARGLACADSETARASGHL